ncbi:MULTISPECIES: hypothetical protein [Pseudomonas]|uniref:hypothetical protein n=1 Tax=Pseudomonas TaxID=286 RepID=UPI0011B6778C|nr:hypothetical protein [Pseudomonas sp. LB-090624]
MGKKLRNNANKGIPAGNARGSRPDRHIHAAFAYERHGTPPGLEIVVGMEVACALQGANR